ncbi:PepSY domain-containing protein [Hyphobacterium sp.]|jgi:uncharacterized membrane protein YkoI|uniref:PepSY domain-containing protein n=1 Tax=Hyphobacterium sp. TaxID=2004662 RepID=UPI003BAC81DC
MHAVTRWLIRLHKWAALVIGLQVLAWVAGGVVMSAIPIERVRGEHNIAETTERLDLTGVRSPAEIAASAVIVPRTVELRPWLGRTVYEFGRDRGLPVLIDAVTGEVLSPIDEETAIAVARADYAGEAEIEAVTFFGEATWESRRDMPTWRIDFADGEGTRLYVSAATGEVVARRNDVWRVYDFFWMLHIMDYSERSNFNHPLLIAASLFALGMSLFGFILLFPWLARLLARRRPPP